MSVRDGASCPGCGLSNYEGLCPHCRGDQDAYEHELVPPFPASLEPKDAVPAAGARRAKADNPDHVSRPAGGTP